MINDNCQPPQNRAYTYILRCSDGTLYSGWTNNITSRLYMHNSGKGAKYTSSRRPVKLVYSEIFKTKNEAMKRENQIKKLKRKEKEALILTQVNGEPLTIYDSHGNPCGERPRSIVHSQGLFHYVCHLWVTGTFCNVYGVWLQQRELDRPLYPGFYDLSSTGHIDPSETPEAAVIREAEEEIGLSINNSDIISVKPCRQKYLRDSDSGFDDELAFPFLTRIDGTPGFLTGDEVREMAFASFDDFEKAHENPSPLPSRHIDGTEFYIPNEKLCCLHQEEFENVKTLLKL